MSATVQRRNFQAEDSVRKNERHDLRLFHFLDLDFTNNILSSLHQILPANDISHRVIKVCCRVHSYHGALRTATKNSTAPLVLYRLDNCFRYNDFPADGRAWNHDCMPPQVLWPGSKTTMDPEMMPAPLRIRKVHPKPDHHSQVDERPYDDLQSDQDTTLDMEELMEGVIKLNMELQDSVACGCGDDGTALNIASLITTVPTKLPEEPTCIDRHARTGASSEMNMSKKSKQVGEPALTYIPTSPNRLTRCLPGDIQRYSWDRPHTNIATKPAAHGAPVSQAVACYKPVRSLKAGSEQMERPRILSDTYSLPVHAPSAS